MRDPFWRMILILVVTGLLTLQTHPTREVEPRPITPASPGAVRSYP